MYGRGSQVDPEEVEVTDGCEEQTNKDQEQADANEELTGCLFVFVCVYEYWAKLRIFCVTAIPTTGDGSAFFLQVWT